MKSLDDIHAMLPDMDGFAYFQTSGFSPKLLPVVDEVIHWFRFQSRGPALPTVSEKSQEVFEEARKKVANSVNAEPGEIVLGENTTVGINIVANGIDWKPGDNVILSSHEHPGNRLTWYNIADRYGVNLKYLRISNDPSEMLGELKTLIDETTRLISISHVSRRTGVRVPAKEMCRIAHAKDVPVLLDGAQSFGAIPIDVHDLNCDFYSFCGHKYIMAPQGTGALYIRKDRIDWLKPS
jgi:selenocysteine lyase/cysteine desulfurase